MSDVLDNAAPTPIKLQPDEIQQFQNFQAQLNALLRTCGELNYQRKLIDDEISNAYAGLDAVDASRNEFIKSLEKKYGTGTVNLSTGEFTPVQNNG